MTDSFTAQSPNQATWFNVKQLKTSLNVKTDCRKPSKLPNSLRQYANKYREEGVLCLILILNVKKSQKNEEKHLN